MTNQNQNQNQNQSRSRNRNQNQNQNQNQPAAADALASMAAGAADVAAGAADVAAGESLADRLARLRAAEAVHADQVRAGRKGAPAPREAVKPIEWPDDVREAAESLTPAFMLPVTPPAKGLSREGVCAGRRVFAVGPADDAMLNQPVPTNGDVKRRDVMLDLMRDIIHNRLYGEPVYAGKSLADGGRVDISVFIGCMHLGPRYKTTKWAQTLWNYKAVQTSLLYKIAELSGRYAVLDCDTFKVELVRDFYL